MPATCLLRIRTYISQKNQPQHQLGFFKTCTCSFSKETGHFKFKGKVTCPKLFVSIQASNEYVFDAHLHLIYTWHQI